MNFGFTEEQELLRSEVRRFLDEKAPLDEVRKQVAAAPGFSRELWREIAKLGWVGLTVPEAYGGGGMDFVTLVVVLEEMGRTLFPSPLISTALAAKAIELAGSEAQKARWLPGIAQGESIATLALLEESDRWDAEGITLKAGHEGASRVLHGAKHWVADAVAADLFVVVYRAGAESEALGIAVVDRQAEHLRVSGSDPMDPTKSLGSLLFEGTKVPDEAILGEEGSGWPVVAKLIDVGAVLVTAESVGAAEGALHLTVDYAKQRTQFSSPIGRFQGVKHPLAENYVDIESVKSLVYYAAWALDEGSEDASIAASRAKAYASEVFPRIGIDGVQLHGAIGFTWEYDAQLYLKRSKWVRPAFGDADFHYERVAALGGL